MESHSTDQSQYHFLFLLSVEEMQINHSSITIQHPDNKVLYMTARPGRDRAFLSAERFMNTWIHNLSIFSLDPPQIAFISSSMKVGFDKIGEAIAISMSNPKKEIAGVYQFDFPGVKDSSIEGTYQEVTFFIDWPARVICPEPIQLLIPSLFEKIK